MSAAETPAVPRADYPTVMTRMHPEVKAELQRRAKAAGRSVNQEVNSIICAALGLDVAQFPVHARGQQVTPVTGATHGH